MAEYERTWAPTADRTSGYPSRMAEVAEATNQQQAQAVVHDLLRAAILGQLNEGHVYEARPKATVMYRLAGGGPGYTLTFTFDADPSDYWQELDESQVEYAVLNWVEFGGEAYEVLDARSAGELWTALNSEVEE